MFLNVTPTALAASVKGMPLLEIVTLFWELSLDEVDSPTTVTVCDAAMLTVWVYVL